MACTNHPTVVEGLAPCFRCGKEFCPNCRVELKGHSYCATCKKEQVRDIQSGADATELELASIGSRFAALLLDGLLLLLVVLPINFGLTFLYVRSIGVPEAALGAQLVIGLIASIPGLLYEGLMIQSRGQTLGKMALKIKVVTPDGSDVAAGQAWTRAAVRLVFNNLHILFIINYIPAFVRKEKTCIHDLAASTRVIVWKR